MSQQTKVETRRILEGAMLAADVELGSTYRDRLTHAVGRAVGYDDGWVLLSGYRMFKAKAAYLEPTDEEVKGEVSLHSQDLEGLRAGQNRVSIAIRSSIRHEAVESWRDDESQQVVHRREPSGGRQLSPRAGD